MRFLRTRFAVLAEVFESPQLRRLELSLWAFWAGEWAQFVALSVYAYDRRGATTLRFRCHPRSP